MSKLLKLIVLCCVISVSGCASFSTTMLSRLDDNSLWGNSNGNTTVRCRTRPYKGVPITLKIPTHLDVYIDEEYYLKIAQDKITEPLENKCRLLSVRTAMVYSDKVFTVDFKRPGAGTLGLNLGFDEDEQYFNSIDSKLKDDTITASAALVAGVIDSLQAQSKAVNTSSGPESTKYAAGGQNTDTAQPVLSADTRVVAYQRFDINALDFEKQVADFVNHHLNCCNQCCLPPTYDAVSPGH